MHEKAARKYTAGADTCQYRINAEIFIAALAVDGARQRFSKLRTV